MEPKDFTVSTWRESLTELCSACLSELIGGECSGCARIPDMCICRHSALNALRIAWSHFGTLPKVFIPASFVLIGVGYVMTKIPGSGVAAVSLSIVAVLVGFSFMALAAFRVFRKLK